MNASKLLKLFFILTLLMSLGTATLAFAQDDAGSDTEDTTESSEMESTEATADDSDAEAELPTESEDTGEETTTDNTADTEETTDGADATEETADDSEADDEADEVTVSVSDGSTYVIQPGDTLYSIATRNGLTVTQLAAYNNIMNVSLIYWGQTLQIPPSEVGTGGPQPSNDTETPDSDETEESTDADEGDATDAAEGSTDDTDSMDELGESTTTYTVRTGDNLYRISLRFNTSIEELIVLNDIQNANLIFSGQELTVPAS